MLTARWRVVLGSALLVAVLLGIQVLDAPGPTAPRDRPTADSAPRPPAPAVPSPMPAVAPRSSVATAPTALGTAMGRRATRPFRFHIYDIPKRYVEGALEELKSVWHVSLCNRRKGSEPTNYTMLDWRHAHSLFTVDVFMARWMRHHPQHTEDPAEADVFIIPMMTHVYNCAGTMRYMNEILGWVTQQRRQHYRELDHHDHFVFWWRWGMHYGSVNKFWARLTKYFPNINFISFDYLELQGRNDFQDFSLALKPNYRRYVNSVIVPYPDFSPHLVEPVAPAARHAPRRTFFYFTGTSTIGGIRRWINRSCEAAERRSPGQRECVFEPFATNVVDGKRIGVPSAYPRNMRDSVFCGHAAGDALSSRRPTSAVLAGCIPVLICDLCFYAWEDVIDYSTFAVFVPEDDVLAGRLIAVLRAIPAARVEALQQGLAEVRSRFVYRTDGPPRPGDALDTLVGQLEVRGRLFRQHRRWFRANANLSSAASDYPLVPKPRKRYVRPGEEHDFNNLAGRAA